MSPSKATLTVAVVSARFGSEFAWIDVVPIATPVTGTVTLVAFAWNVIEAGTVATPVLSELRAIVSPAGAGADRLSVRFPVPPTPTVRLETVKLSVAVTWTDLLSPSKPGADAVMVAVPKLTPATSGCVSGTIAPCGMKTLGGTVATDSSLLASVIVTPPTGAELTRVTGNGTD
jgi:hypothetical protein